MYCKDCLHIGVCRYASGIRLSKKEPCADFMGFDEWAKLPCKAGDILYEPTDRGTISEYEVTAVCMELFSTFVEYKIKDENVWKHVHEINSNEIGKTVFLTREEAKRALKERERNDK